MPIKNGIDFATNKFDLLPPAPNTSPLCGEGEGADPATERAEVVEARELLQVTKQHFNTAPFAVRMLYFKNEQK